MTFVPVDEISEVFEQAFGKRMITPALLGDDSAKSTDKVVPMRRSAKRPEPKRPPTRRRSAVGHRKA